MASPPHRQAGLDASETAKALRAIEALLRLPPRGHRRDALLRTSLEAARDELDPDENRERPDT